jgi:hypothetical protein
MYELSKGDIERLADLVKRVENFKGDWAIDNLAYEAMDFLDKKGLMIKYANWFEKNKLMEFFGREGIQKYQEIDKEFVLKLLTEVAREEGRCCGGGLTPWRLLFHSGDGLALFKRLLEIETNDVEQK